MNNFMPNAQKNDSRGGELRPCSDRRSTAGRTDPRPSSERIGKLEILRRPRPLSLL